MMNLKNKISQIYSPGAHQLTFSAKHAFFDLFFYPICFTP